MGLFNRLSSQELILKELKAIRYGIQYLCNLYSPVEMDLHKSVDEVELKEKINPGSNTRTSHTPYEPSDIIITDPQHQLREELKREMGDDSEQMLAMLKELAEKDPDNYERMWKLMGDFVGEK